MKKIILCVIAMVLIAIATGSLFNVLFPKEAEVIEKTDTLYVHDTVTIEKFVPKESKVVETMLVAVHDTIVKNDTVFISLPRESKTYGDERYTAVVSGYKPSLDRLEIYIENQVVTKYLIPEPVKLKKNYLSVGAEVAYIGGTTIPIYLEYERLLHKNVGIYGKVLYDLPTKDIGAGIGVRAKFGW